MTVWRRLREWTHANVWPAVHERLLAHLGRAGPVDVDTVVADSASVRAVKGGCTPARTRPTGAKTAVNGTS